MDLLYKNTIDVVDKISETAFVQMYLGQQAVLIKGMVDDWPATHLWTPQSSILNESFSIV